MSKKNRKSKEPVSPKGISNHFYIFLLIIIPLVLNWKEINYQFTTFDDSIIISNNYHFLGDFKNVFMAFGKDSFISKSGETYYRPMQTVSFMIDAQISGDQAYGYHLSNILYHILTVIVLFFLLQKLGVRENISFYFTLLFSVHPLLTDAIAWIPGRGDLLAGLFCSVSFLTFIYYNSTRNKLFLLFHSAVFLLAIFSKEISIFLPVILIFYYRLVLKNKTKGLFPYIWVWSLSVLAFFSLRFIYLNTQTIVGFDAFTGNLQMIPILLSKIIIPIGLSPMPVYDILFTLTGIIVIIISGIFLRKVKTGNKSIIILGILWFLGFIIPAMFVKLPFSKVHFDYLECRAYLPSIGIFISLSVLLNEIIKEKRGKVLIMIIMPAILTFAILSYSYSEAYADGVSLFSSLIKSDQKNAFAYSERGRIYLSKKDYDPALSDFDNSIRISPTYSHAYFHKGTLFNSTNNPVKAEQSFSTALKYDTLYPEINSLHEHAYYNFSSVELNLKKYEDAIILLNKGINKYPANGSLHNNLGLAYYNTAKYDSALYEYNRAINTEQNNPSYYNNRGLTEYHLNNTTGAIADFSRALDLNPDYFLAWGNRGRAKMNLKDYDGAISDFTKALSIKRNIATVLYLRGLAYSKLNRQTEAERDWAGARRLGYREPMSEKQKEK